MFYQIRLKFYKEVIFSINILDILWAKLFFIPLVKKVVLLRLSEVYLRLFPHVNQLTVFSPIEAPGAKEMV